MNNTRFEEKSYTSHEKWYEQFENGTERIESKGTIDYWRHERMYDLTSPLISKEDLWLTVGDGSGTDANWLIGKGVSTMASDIADTILKVCKEQGLIEAFSKENAEKLSFDNQSFDYVMCKESYHHFPRPYLALYEMVRVAKKGVVLLEPIDIGMQYPPILILKNILDRINTSLINKIWKNRFSFETVGNYVYKISEREIEKAAMGLNLPYVAFKGFNDYYSENANLDKPITDLASFNFVKRKIGFKDILCKLGLIPYQSMAAIIFTSEPSQNTLDQLKENGFKVVKLAVNPYL